jgi:hypothetical protein
MFYCGISFSPTVLRYSKFAAKKSYYIIVFIDSMDNFYRYSDVTLTFARATVLVLLKVRTMSTLRQPCSTLGMH